MSERRERMSLPEKPQRTIIWTPRFIILFSLIFVVGLSVASLLTQGWLNGYYAAEWVLLALTALLLGCWIALLIFARSQQARLGAIFGGLWAIFNGISLLTTLFKGPAAASINGYTNIVLSCSLLGCYVCLSNNRARSSRWDRWLQYGILLAGGLIILALFWFSSVHTLNALETTIATVGLYLCVCIWWLRPACWGTQPAPTFLLGMAPAILLLLSLPHKGEANFFFSQVILLCLLLGAIRVLQGEIRSGFPSTR